MKGQDQDAMEQRIVSAINAHVDKRFDAMKKYIDQKVDPIVETQQEHTQTLAKHTGFLAELSVKAKTLDEERLSAIARMDRLQQKLSA